MPAYIQYVRRNVGKHQMAAWRAMFHKIDARPLFEMPPENRAISRAVSRRLILLPSTHNHDTTLSTIVTAVWALLLSQHIHSSNIFFELMLSGRNTPIPGIEHTMGPLFTMVPLVIAVPSAEHLVDEYPRDMQQRIAEV